MNYYIDTQFIEGFKKPIKWLPTIGNFNKPYHSIQLISIGIVAEDGREYYAISNEFNPDDANGWVRENVLRKLPQKTFNGHNIDEAKLWKNNKQIEREIIEFVVPTNEVVFCVNCYGKWDIVYQSTKRGGTLPTFYAYYADYDWVLFCSLFGTMMDLPKGFPMYCRDLKQMQDEAAVKIKGFVPDTPAQVKIDAMKHHVGYPKQNNEHHALEDAKWNKQLHEFLKGL